MQGSTFGDAARAYPVKTLQQERIVNDTLSGTDVVLFASAESSSVRVYRSKGHVFSIPEDEIDNTGLFSKLVDSRGVEWTVTEEALVNTQDIYRVLKRVPANISFWFGWFSFNIETEVYGIDSN